MAVPADTFQTYQSVGNREELHDVIYDISPEDTPFMNNVGSDAKAKSTFPEWQVDELADRDLVNHQIEGDDANFIAIVPTERIGNRTQISTKAFRLTGTQEVVDKAGRKSEMAYQLARKGAELKLDIESIALANQGSVAGNSSTAREAGGMLAFLKTNVSMGVGGANPVYTTEPTGERTDGTQRAFTEAQLRDVLAQCYTEGAKPKIIMVGAINKQNASSFTGIAQIRAQVSGRQMATIYGGADAYVSDFGTLTFVPSRNMRARDCLVIDPKMASFCYLRKFQTKTLAVTGDADNRFLLAEWTLKVKNEKAHGLIADLTTTIT